MKQLLSYIFLSPGEPRLRAGWRFLAQSLILAFILLLAGVPISFLYLLFPDLNFFILNTVISLFAFPLSIYIARRFIDRRSFVSLGLRLTTQAVKDLAAGFWIAGFMMGAIFVIELAAGWLTVQEPGWEGQSPVDFLIQVVTWLLIFLAVGFYEELTYRGYQLQNIEEGTNTFIGVLFSSLIFGLDHYQNPNAGWGAVAGIAMAGLFLAFGYLRTRQLWLPIGAHIGWNFFEGVVFGFPVSGLELPGLIRIQMNGPEYLTGGAFGPEAGLVLLPGVMIGAGLIFWYTRNRTIHKENDDKQTKTSIENNP